MIMGDAYAIPEKARAQRAVPLQFLPVSSNKYPASAVSTASGYYSM
jgi:hypothetical protein